MASEKPSPALSEAGDVEAQQTAKDATTTVSEKHTSAHTRDEAITDPNIVDWDGPNDPHNPRNWSAKAKVVNTLLVISLTFLTPLASSMFAPGVPDVLRDFNSTNSPTIAAFVVSIYLLGFAIGPLLISPLSELYGRWPVYTVCNVMFLIFTIACAVAGNMTQLLVFRFFAGCAGVCPVTLGGASIADLIVQERRGTVISLFSMGPLLGPVIGPIAGGYLSSSAGWRWTFWVIAIAYAICTIAFTAFCRETYSPVLLERKAAKLRKETGNTALRSAQDSGLTAQVRITRAMVRPFKMLTLSAIVGLMSLYIAVIYGILYLLYTTFTFVFIEQYHFSPASVGLTFIASGVGMFIGLALTGTLSDRLLKSMAAKHGGELKPEYRLLPSLYTGWLLPAGLFIYGWTVQYHVHWAVPMFGTLLFGIGIIVAMISIQQYLIDAYVLYAASSIAANTVLRSIVGGLLPLAGLSMYDTLGLGWGNSLIAFLSVALIPIPFVFYYCGERLRKNSKLVL